jgi:hypothetical protein
MIFGGFVNNHSADGFRVLNPHTQRTTNNTGLTGLDCMIYVMPYMATHKLIPKISIPLYEQGLVDDRDDTAEACCMCLL